MRIPEPDPIWHGKGATGINSTGTYKCSVAEPEPVEPNLFGDLEPEPKINLNKHFMRSVWRMLRRRKAKFYLY